MRGDCSDELREFVEGRRKSSLLGGKFVRRGLEGREKEREVPELRRLNRISIVAVLHAVSLMFDKSSSVLLKLTGGRGGAPLVWWLCICFMNWVG